MIYLCFLNKVSHFLYKSSVKIVPITALNQLCESSNVANLASFSFEFSVEGHRYLRLIKFKSFKMNNCCRHHKHSHQNLTFTLAVLFIIRLISRKLPFTIWILININSDPNTSCPTIKAEMFGGLRGFFKFWIHYQEVRKSSRLLKCTFVLPQNGSYASFADFTD